MIARIRILAPAFGIATLAALAMPAMLAGCGSDSSPPATFTQIYSALFPPETPAKCNFCHGMAPSDISNGHLHLGEQATAYAALVGQVSTSSRCMGQPLVVAGQPDQSLLLSKLTDTPPCGSRMPLGSDSVGPTELAIVRSWIAAGASND